LGLGYQELANQRRNFHHQVARALVARYDLLAVEDLTIRNMVRRHTSDRCGTCGHTAKDNRVSQAQFSCRRCGHTLNADEHAARNILRAGLARLAADPAV
jgi:transposase